VRVENITWKRATMFDLVLGAVVATALLIYLVNALMKAEKL
jgi:K+-transporting ATPase KdpF subunit